MRLLSAIKSVSFLSLYRITYLDQMIDIVLKALAKKKLQIFFLFYLILTLPLLTPLSENLTWSQSIDVIVVNSILFLSLSVLSLFCNSRIEKLAYSGVFIISYLPFAIYTSYLLFAGVVLEKNSTISLFETNPAETKEFLTNYFNPWIIVACLAYILFCFLIIWIMKSKDRLKIKDHKPTFYISLAILLSVLISPSLSKRIYFINFYRMYFNYLLDLGDDRVAISERQGLTYDVRTSQKDSVPKTIVVVIGESLTRNHMSLYGYGRMTNPVLSRYGEELLVYRDVISPQVHTIPVLRSVLTLSDRSNPDNIKEKPSLFELFNRAGYSTSLITNQPFGGRFQTSYDLLLNLSQNIYDLSSDSQPDEIILPVLKNILNTKSKENKLILIHLIGNHVAYEFRYTPSFNQFKNKEDGISELTDYRDQQAIHTIDKYDNSVLYNDSVVSSMIGLLKEQTDQELAFIYFSDHGEEVYDFRKFSGHAYEKASTYMCEIPFLVWLSPTYLKGRADLVVDKNRPFSTSDFLYSLSNLAGIEYSDYDKTKSLFSPHFSPSERFVGLHNYKMLLEKEEARKP